VPAGWQTPFAGHDADVESTHAAVKVGLPGWNPGSARGSIANAKIWLDCVAMKSLSLVTSRTWRPSGRSGPNASPSIF